MPSTSPTPPPTLRSPAAWRSGPPEPACRHSVQLLRFATATLARSDLSSEGQGPCAFENRPTRPRSQPEGEHRAGCRWQRLVGGAQSCLHRAASSGAADPDRVAGRGRDGERGDRRSFGATVTARSHSRWATNVDSRARAGALRPGLPAGTRGSAGPAGAGKHGGCANHEAEVVPVAVVVHVVDAHVVVEQ